MIASIYRKMKTGARIPNQNKSHKRLQKKQKMKSNCQTIIPGVEKFNKLHRLKFKFKTKQKKRLNSLMKMNGALLQSKSKGQKKIMWHLFQRPSYLKMIIGEILSKQHPLYWIRFRQRKRIKRNSSLIFSRNSLLRILQKRLSLQVDYNLNQASRKNKLWKYLKNRYRSRMNPTLMMNLRMYNLLLDLDKKQRISMTFFLS